MSDIRVNGHRAFGPDSRALQSPSRRLRRQRRQRRNLRPCGGKYISMELLTAPGEGQPMCEAQACAHIIIWLTGIAVEPKTHGNLLRQYIKIVKISLIILMLKLKFRIPEEVEL